MHLTTPLAAFLCALPTALSAPTSGSPHEDPQMCGYVLTERNSSSFASLSTYFDCTAIYYNQSISGYQDAYAYSIFGGCRCTFYSNEDECVDDAEVLVYEGPIGKIGAEPLFDAPRPTWYYCETMGF